MADGTQFVVPVLKRKLQLVRSRWAGAKEPSSIDDAREVMESTCATKHLFDG